MNSMGHKDELPRIELNKVQRFDDTEYVIVCLPPNGIKQALFVDKYNAKKKVLRLGFSRGGYKKFKDHR